MLQVVKLLSLLLMGIKLISKLEHAYKIKKYLSALKLLKKVLHSKVSLQHFSNKSIVSQVFASFRAHYVINYMYVKLSTQIET